MPILESNNFTADDLRSLAEVAAKENKPFDRFVDELLKGELITLDRRTNRASIVTDIKNTA